MDISSLLRNWTFTHKQVDFLPCLYFFPCGRLGIHDSFGGDSIAISITSYGRAACLCDKLFGFGIGLVDNFRHCEMLWGLGRLCCGIGGGC